MKTRERIGELLRQALAAARRAVLAATRSECWLCGRWAPATCPGCDRRMCCRCQSTGEVAGGCTGCATARKAEDEHAARLEGWRTVREREAMQLGHALSGLTTPKE